MTLDYDKELLLENCINLLYNQIVERKDELSKTDRDALKSMEPGEDAAVSLSNYGWKNKSLKGRVENLVEDYKRLVELELPGADEPTRAGHVVRISPNGVEGEEDYFLLPASSLAYEELPHENGDGIVRGMTLSCPVGRSLMKVEPGEEATAHLPGGKNLTYMLQDRK